MAITLNGTLGVTSPGFEPTSNTVPVSGFYLPSANTVGLVTGSTERVRIDSSGNVGIGTSSPGAKLATNSAQSGDNGATSATRTLFQQQTSGTQATASVFSVFGVIHPSVYKVTLDSSTGSGAAAPLVFSTANNTVETMRLDSSGNLGLGVTPSGWGGSTLKAMQFPGYGAISSDATYGTFALSNNAYSDNTGNSYKYIASSIQASLYRQTGGQHQWLYAGTGTAGNAISFTQAMTLDANGNLLVGTTTNGGAKLKSNVTSSGATPFNLVLSNMSAAALNNGTSLVFNNSQDFSDNNFTYNSARIQSVITNGTSQASALTFSTYDGSTGCLERGRIDSSGRLLVGTTSVPGSLGNLYAIVNQGVSVINSGTTTAFFQVYNSNAGTDLKTWRLGNTDNTGALVLQSVNDAYTSANERLRVDASGRMTVPGQPAFYAVPPANYTLNGGDQTISGTWSEITDRSNSFNNGTFTAPVSGFYYFTWSSFVTSTSTRNDAYILVNGAMKARSEISGYAAGTTNRSSMVSVGVYLSANDNVTVGVYINGTGNTYTSQPPWGNFSGFLVG